jgi:antirestriction protein
MTDEQQPPEYPGDAGEQASSPEHRQPETPSIWVGSLADYNNGDLHGQWLDAAREAADVHADIQAMLSRGPAAARGDLPEEWGIFDYEGFGRLRIGESETIEYVSQVARGIAEHGPAFAAWADVMEEQDLLDGFADAYLGHYDSIEAYAESWLDDAGYDRLLEEIIPESIRPYVRFDAAALGRDLCLGGDVHVLAADTGGVFVFRAS